MTKSKIDKLSKRLATLQRTVKQQRKSIEYFSKAEERRSFSGNNNWGASSREDRFRPSTSEDYLQLFESYIHIFACIDAISRNCAKIPRKIYKLVKQSATKDRLGEEITDGQWWSLLNTPNPNMSGYGLLYGIAAFTKLTGISFLEKVGKIPSEPLQLWLLRPDWMKIIPDKVKMISGYEYLVDGSVIKFTPEEITRIKTWHPRSELYGLSIVSPAASSIITDLYAVKYTKQFFKQGGHINWYISAKEEMSDESFNRLEQQIKTKISGLENAHAPWVLDAGADLKELGGSPDRNTLLPQKTLSRDEVCEAFGVPAMMLGLPNETHYNNADAQKLFFWEETIQPFNGEIDATLNRDIFWPMQMEIKSDYSGVSVLQPDTTKKSTTARQLVDGRIFTPNEARADFFGKEPIEGGDKFPEIPGPNQFNISQNPQPSAPSSGVSTEAGTIAEATLNGAQIAAAVSVVQELAFGTIGHVAAIELLTAVGIPRERAEIIANEKVVKPTETPPVIPAVKSAKREALKKVVVDHTQKLFQMAYPGIEKAMIDIYKEMGKAVIGVIGGIAKSIIIVKKDLVEEALAALDSKTKKMIADLLTVEKSQLAKIITEEYGRIKSETIDEQTLTELDGKVGTQLDRLVKESIGFMTDTAKKRTEAKLTELLEGDASAGEMTKVFQEMFEGTDREGPMWARTVARTETLKYTSNARFATMGELGYEDKQWFHSGHDPARPEHKAADGEIVKMGEKFSTGLMFPGDPVNGEAGDVVNCGCTFSEYVKGMAE